MRKSKIEKFADLHPQKIIYTLRLAGCSYGHIVTVLGQIGYPDQTVREVEFGYYAYCKRENLKPNTHTRLSHEPQEVPRHSFRERISGLPPLKIEEFVFHQRHNRRLPYEKIATKIKDIGWPEISKDQVTQMYKNICIQKRIRPLQKV